VDPLVHHLDQPIELTRARTWPHVPDQANAPAPARTSRWPRIDQPTAPTLHVPMCPRPSQRMTQPFYYRASVIPRATTLSHFLCYSAQPFLVLQCSSFFDCYSAQSFLTATMLNYFFYCYNAQSFIIDTVLSHSSLIQCSIIPYYYSAQLFSITIVLSHFSCYSVQSFLVCYSARSFFVAIAHGATQSFCKMTERRRTGALSHFAKWLSATWARGVGGKWTSTVEKQLSSL
jgi:hypothetical protein